MVISFIKVETLLFIIISSLAAILIYLFRKYKILSSYQKQMLIIKIHLVNSVNVFVILKVENYYLKLALISKIKDLKSEHITDMMIIAQPMIKDCN